MKSKNLLYLFILFFMGVAIVFLGGYEYVKAQTYETLNPQPWRSLRPYNLLWPSQITTWPQTNITTSYAPVFEPLTIFPDLTRSMMITQTPGMYAMDWQQEINIRTSMPFPPSYGTDYGYNMLGPQPQTPDLADYGSEFLHDWGQMEWNPYAYVGRFAPARIRSSLYEFSTQIPEQNLFPTPDRWQPFGGSVAVPGGGGDWTGYGAFGPSGGGWTSFGSIGLGMSGFLGYR